MVSAAPTSTTNITGFFASVTGFSLTNDSLMARRTISGSNSGRARASFLGRSERLIVVELRRAEVSVSGGHISSKLRTSGSENNFPSCIRKCSTIGPSESAGK